MKNKIICKNCGSSNFELISSKMDYYEDLMRGLYGRGGIEEPKLKCKHCGWEFKPDTKDFINSFFKQ